MQESIETGNTCIVDQYVEAAERTVDPGAGIFDLMEHGDITGDDFRLSPVVENRLGRRVQSGLRAPAQNRGSAEGRQLPSYGSADAAACSRDDCNLSGKGLLGVHMKMTLLGVELEANSEWEHPSRYAMRILAIKGCVNGKSLAFGKRGTYNPANRENGYVASSLQPGYPSLSRGPARKPGIPKQDPNAMRSRRNAVAAEL